MIESVNKRARGQGGIPPLLRIERDWPPALPELIRVVGPDYGLALVAAVSLGVLSCFSRTTAGR